MSSNYSPKVAIVIPTIFRDDLLMDTIETIIENCDMEETKIIIVDQNKEETYSERKRIFYEVACSQFHSEKRIEVIKVPYDSGISYCRNVAVELAKEQNIPYCFITADSIEFTESMKKLPKLLTYMKRYDIIGLDIKDRIGWEGILRLIPNDCFELEFIDKTCKLCSPKKLIIFHCDIVRNFFIGKTKVLYKIKWDNELKCREHESFFYEAKKQNVKVGFTKYCFGDYKGEKYKRGDNEYAKLRRKNMDMCREILFKKYNLKRWITYKHLERKNQ